ncbi:LysR family transcriptional regulator [Cupriavidus basilensis]
MELFLSISKTESFSETARHFGVSATSVSRMITDFETELNVKLLMRSTRQVVLTEAGQEYARELEGILWNIGQAHPQHHRDPRRPEGPRCGCTRA